MRNRNVARLKSTCTSAAPDGHMVTKVWGFGSAKCINPVLPLNFLDRSCADAGPQLPPAPRGTAHSWLGGLEQACLR